MPVVRMVKAPTPSYEHEASMSAYEHFDSAPTIRTELPGPKASQLIESDHRYLSPSYTRFYPLVVKRGEGPFIEDVDGNVFLDFTAGIAVCSTGHCHPQIVRAIQRQAEQLIHMSGADFYYAQQSGLAQRLAEIAPGSSPKRVFLANSGTESIEAAFKLARYHTRRQQAVAFFGAFHGRTMGSLSLTGSRTIQRRGFEPLIPGVRHIPYPDCYRCPIARNTDSCCMRPLQELKENLFRHIVDPEEIAAFIVEPIQGEGGYIVPPPEFHRELKLLAERYGILYIADEIQTGMGRTGKMFAIEHWGVEPDIVCLAKGVASGMPLGAMVAREELMDWPPGSHASTFGGNPISCAAALETISLLEQGLTDNAARMGDFLLSSLRELQSQHSLIGELRGKGLMIGIELVRNPTTKERAIEERDALVDSCFRKGLLLLGCGENTVRLAPPLVIDRNQAETALTILDEALGELSGQEE